MGIHQKYNDTLEELASIKMKHSGEIKKLTADHNIQLTERNTLISKKDYEINRLLAQQKKNVTQLKTKSTTIKNLRDKLKKAEKKLALYKYL